jgi:hypothetical protein
VRLARGSVPISVPEGLCFDGKGGLPRRLGREAIPSVAQRGRERTRALREGRCEEEKSEGIAAPLGPGVETVDVLWKMSGRVGSPAMKLTDLAHQQDLRIFVVQPVTPGQEADRRLVLECHTARFAPRPQARFGTKKVTVVLKPELSRSGLMNEKHVKVCPGKSKEPCPLGPIQENPVPKKERIN